jgi:hypothetical protein
MRTPQLWLWHQSNQDADNAILGGSHLGVSIVRTPSHLESRQLVGKSECSAATTKLGVGALEPNVTFATSATLLMLLATSDFLLHDTDIIRRAPQPSVTSIFAALFTLGTTICW